MPRFCDSTWLHFPAARTLIYTTHLSCLHVTCGNENQPHSPNYLVSYLLLTGHRNPINMNRLEISGQLQNYEDLYEKTGFCWNIAWCFIWRPFHVAGVPSRLQTVYTIFRLNACNALLVSTKINIQPKSVKKGFPVNAHEDGQDNKDKSVGS